MGQISKVFIACVVLAISIIFLAWYSPSAESNQDAASKKSANKITIVNPWDEMPDSDIAKIVLGPIKAIQNGLINAMNEGRIKSDELEKLDFKWPANSGFGENIDYEVFNTKSPRSIIDQGNIDVDEAKSLNLILNLRRVTQEKIGRITDSLIVFIPEMKEKDCEEIGRVQQIEKISPNNLEIIEDKKFLSLSCVQLSTGELYFPVSIFSRSKKISSDTWAP